MPEIQKGDSTISLEMTADMQRTPHCPTCSLWGSTFGKPLEKLALGDLEFGKTR